VNRNWAQLNVLEFSFQTMRRVKGICAALAWKIFQYGALNRPLVMLGNIIRQNIFFSSFFFAK
jgi:hypothetical protein